MKKKLLLIYPRQAFVGAGTTDATRFPPLGLGYVAALTPPHWEVKILDEMWGDVDYEECDLVGISAMTAQANRGYELAKLFRSRAKKVVMGGIHPTMMPDEARQYADAVVVGEAENTWKQVVADFEAGTLAPIYRSDQEVDLDNLVRPRRELFDKRYAIQILQTTRGCPMNCEFCSVTTFYGYKYRKRPVAAVLDELQSIPNPVVFFADDNLLGYSPADQERFIELMKGMKERGIKKRWLAQMSMNFCDNEQALQLAAETGCLLVLLGIESIDQQVLAGHMGKRVNLDRVKTRQSIKNVHRHGINIMGSFIVGNDEDTPETFDRLVRYIKRNHIDLPSVNCIVPFPGTKLEKRLSAENRLGHRTFPKDWDIYNTGNRAMVDTANMTRVEINRQVRRLYLRLYNRRAIWIRALTALLRTRDVANFKFVLQSNIGWRGRFFNTAAFKDPEGAL